MLISDNGTTGDDTALLCHTNRPPPSDSSNSGGQWFRSDQTEIEFFTNTGGFKRNRGPMVVRLYRDNPPQVQGIYYCQIEDHTNMVHIVSVGLYNSVGGMYTPACIYCAFYYHYLDIEAINVSNYVEFNLITESLFTLTCTSTGGPATYVTWTRDNVTITEGAETNFDTDDRNYGNALTVTGRLEGLYTCTVANDRPSNASATISVQGNNL